MEHPPGKQTFTNKEWQVIQSHRTPAQVQHYLRRLPYNWERQGETLRSFRQVVRLNTAHCLEAALVAAVILEQHGYPPLLLSIESQDQLDHVVFVFRKNGRWGAVARSRDLGLHGRKAVFRTIRQLVWSYFDPFIDNSGRITGYGVANLHVLGNYDWRLSEKNVWKVERYLCEMPHRKLDSSDRRYEKFFARFREFKSHHPREPVTHFVDRHHWLL